MKKKLIFIIPIIFLLLSIFNFPACIPQAILTNHYYLPYLNYINPDYYYDILKKYKKITIFNGLDYINLNLKNYDSLDDFINKLSELNNTNQPINFYYFIRFITNNIKILEKASIILPFYPARNELTYMDTVEKTTGIPLKIIYEDLVNNNLLLSINYKLNLNEKTVRLNLLFSKAVQEFSTIELYNVENDRKIFIEKESVENIVENSFIFDYLYNYSKEKNSDKLISKNKIEFEINFIGKNSKSISFQIGLTEEIDRNILFVGEEKKDNFFSNLYQYEYVNLKNIKDKNLNNYSLIVFDGIPIKKIDMEISKKIADGFNQDDFGLFFISEGKEIGKTSDNPIIEEILPIELTPKSLKQDPKVAILVLLDVSSSMMGEKLSIAKVSASQLLTHLKPDDLTSIYLFWDQFAKLFNFMPVKEVTGFFSFDKIEATGGTDLAPCLIQGLKDLLKVPVTNRHAIIISDFQTKPASWESILTTAIDNDISISVIQIGTDINPSLAEKIANLTGGSIYTANSFDQIPTILFEDRKRIARPPFLKQKYLVFDSYNDFVTQIEGMNITSSKENSDVVLKNQYNDPIFSFIKKGSKGSAVFLSDFHGIYTRNLLNNQYFKIIFNRYFDSQLSNILKKISIAETAGAFNVTINSPLLYDPYITLFSGTDKVIESYMTKIAQGYYSFSISNINQGLYLLQIKDLGNTMLKLPIYFNGIANSQVYSSLIYSNYNHKIKYRKYYSINIWLILFFLSSIFTTYLLRISAEKKI